ncbi:MAG: helix-turn-helix domain-containing protein [Pyrinomonadaceae bacterium]|jgi:hypothetical protein|nr:helix-turn-helix domain-containing protein [Pyrinomonadaceae bacterium]
MEIENINIHSLPFVTIPERSNLPKIGGLYFVLSENKAVEYIGIAKNLRNRWKAHSCCAELESPKKCSIAWLEIENEKERERLEWLLISSILPPLNTRLKTPYRSSKIQEQDIKFTKNIVEGCEKYLKASEVAVILNVKHVTVRAWLKKGLFPNAKLEETILGKVWLIPESDVKNFEKPKAGRPQNENN